MKRIALALGFFAALLAAGGCKKQQNDNDAIRAGIMQHLTGVGTLNMSAMVMDIQKVSINGNQAHAEVEFRPKTGSPQGYGSLRIQGSSTAAWSLRQDISDFTVMWT